MTENEFHELKSLISSNAPSLRDVIMLVATPKSESKSSGKIFKCDTEWQKFLLSISAVSSVCGLSHPSDRSMKLIKDMCSTDITKNPKSMECLQEEIPVLFELIRTTSSHWPTILQPVLEELLKKAMAPFDQPSCVSADYMQSDESLSYFPRLPKHRNRCMYSADNNNIGKVLTCTKRSSRHPTLLPGVCEHGK